MFLPTSWLKLRRALLQQCRARQRALTGPKARQTSHLQPRGSLRKQQLAFRLPMPHTIEVQPNNRDISGRTRARARFSRGYSLG